MARQTDVQEMWIGLGRAAGGALIFSLPMLMTVEMWEFGASMSRLTLLGMLVVSLPVLMFLSHQSGFEATWGWREDIRDVIIALAIGCVTSCAVLALFGTIDLETPIPAASGMILLQAMPAALGALLARSQFGSQSAEGERDVGYLAHLAIMGIGALYLSFNIAPTDEILDIALATTSIHAVIAVLVSVLLMHGFVYATAFKGSVDLGPDTPWWSAILRFTVPGYLVALVCAGLLLASFGRFEGMDTFLALRLIVVLGLPAAIGAAAARLIL